MKGPPSPRSRPRAASVRRSPGSLWLLVIDERPIRKAAFKAYEKAERQVARARIQVEAFEIGDLPAFTRWEAQIFGALMSQLREITVELGQKQMLLAQIKEEVFWTNCSRPTAYRRIMEAKNNPSPPPPPDFDPSSGQSSADSERPKVFGDSNFPPGFDIDAYDRMSQRRKNEVFEEYEEAAFLYELVYGIKAPDFEELLEHERRSRHGDMTDNEDAHWSSFNSHASTRAQHPPGPNIDRIKELYRTLVRRLHPDAGGAHTARERDLWQQVQDAYHARDLEWLESIAGRLDAVIDRGATLSIQLLRRMTTDLLDALHGLRSQISRHRRHPGWKFREQRKALVKFETKRRCALESQLGRLRRALEKADRILNDLAERAAKQSKANENKTKQEPRKTFPPAAQNARRGNFPF